MMDNDFLNLEEPNGEGSGEQKPQPILGRFATQADLERAYSELEGEHTRKSQELADHKRMLQELQQQQQYQQQQHTPEEEDPNQLFFEAPAQATEKVVNKAMQPLYNFMYEQQKDKFRADPLFLKYEAEIDQLANMQPSVKMQSGSVAQMFKMVKGLHYEDLEANLREQIKAEGRAKIGGSLEGSDAPHLPGNTDLKLPELSDEEKRVAVKFNSGIPKEEAYKKYAEKKAKLGGIK